jgi:DNA-binding MarR family transcriptional regulator
MLTNKDNIFELMLGFSRKIKESTKENSLKNELTFPQFEILWFIGFNGKRSMESIADYLKITPPSATSMVHKMEKRGLLSRKHDIKDKRIVYISLTAKTKKHLKALRKHKEKLLKKIIDKLSQTDKNHFERIIKIIIEK